MLRLEERSPQSHTVAVQGRMPHLGVHNPTQADTTPHGGVQANVSIYNPTQACTATSGCGHCTAPHKHRHSPVQGHRSPLVLHKRWNRRV